jgi:hypothetical protein
MKTKLFILTAILIFTFRLIAQNDSLYISTEVDNVIYAFDFKNAKNILLNFVKSNNIRVLNQKESRTELNIKIVLTQAHYKSLDSIMNKLGHLNSKKSTSVSNFSKINELNLELEYLNQKKGSYSELLIKFDEKSENYIALWKEIKITEEKIFNKERELLGLNKKDNTYSVSIIIKDETTTPEYTDVSFVNMPGFEFSFLNMENPKQGLSSNNYNGYLLKYLFTKGKSFGLIGVYKSAEISSTDTTTLSELFLLGFGQDFYSRHLGRGSRKFFNLYSGYTIGGVMATGKTTRQNMVYVSPTIGLELFKNKFLLIDTKVNYFVPIGDYRFIRGISYNASFNFVF